VTRVKRGQRVPPPHYCRNPPSGCAHAPSALVQLVVSANRAPNPRPSSANGDSTKGASSVAYLAEVGHKRSCLRIRRDLRLRQALVVPCATRSELAHVICPQIERDRLGQTATDRYGGVQLKLSLCNGANGNRYVRARRGNPGTCMRHVSLRGSTRVRHAPLRASAEISHHLGAHARRQRSLAVPLCLHHGEERRQLPKGSAVHPTSLRQNPTVERAEKAACPRRRKPRRGGVAHRVLRVRWAESLRLDREQGRGCREEGEEKPHRGALGPGCCESTPELRLAAETVLCARNFVQGVFGG
jgi:hypothetical protein